VISSRLINHFSRRDLKRTKIIQRLVQRRTAVAIEQKINTYRRFMLRSSTAGTAAKGEPRPQSAGSITEQPAAVLLLGGLKIF